MTGLSASTSVWGLLSFVLVGLIGWGFYRRQNAQRTMGGGISGAKAIWLTYAIYVWFFLTPLLAWDANTPLGFARIFGVFAVSMWVRGLAELAMLYFWKNWKPAYGIAHDCFSGFLILAAAAFVNSANTGEGGLRIWLALYSVFLLFSVACETYYAIVFSNLVGSKTTGDDGIWFASAEDKEFARINKITGRCNTPLVLFLLAFLVYLIGGLGP